MGKSEQKRVASIVERGRKTVVIDRGEIAPSTQERERQLLKVWQPEIEQLSKREFASLDEVLDCLIEKVVAKTDATPEEAEFLRIALVSDPLICTALRTHVRVRQR